MSCSIHLSDLEFHQNRDIMPYAKFFTRGLINNFTSSVIVGTTFVTINILIQEFYATGCIGLFVGKRLCITYYNIRYSAQHELVTLHNLYKCTCRAG